MHPTDEELTAVITNPDRLDVLYKTKILDTPAEKVFDRVTEMICRDLDVPVALVTILEVDRQFFKSHQGLPEEIAGPRQNPMSYSLCKYVAEKRDTVAIPDAQNEDHLKDHPAITEYKIGAYLGTPLIKEGHVLGSLCAIDFQPREWSMKDIQALEKKAEFVNAELALREKIGEDFSGNSSGKT